MKVEDILRRNAEFRRELIDNLKAMNGGQPTPEQMLLVELMCSLQQEVATVVIHFAAVCEAMTGPAGDSPADDTAVSLEQLKALCGGELRCSTCRAVQPVQDPAELHKWMREGFPRCCGHQMLWLTKSELREEALRA